MPGGEIDHFGMDGIAMVREVMREDSRAVREQPQIAHPGDLLEKLRAIQVPAPAFPEPEGVIEDHDIETMPTITEYRPRRLRKGARVRPVEDGAPVPFNDIEHG